MNNIKRAKIFCLLGRSLNISTNLNLKNFCFNLSNTITFSNKEIEYFLIPESLQPDVNLFYYKIGLLDLTDFKENIDVLRQWIAKISNIKELHISSG